MKAEPALFRAWVRSIQSRTRSLAHVAAAGSLVTVACGSQGSVTQAEVRIPPQPNAPPPKALRSGPPIAKVDAGEGPGAPMDEGDDDDPEGEADTCGEVDTRTVSRPQGACTDMTAPAAPSLGCRGCGTAGFGQTKCVTYKQMFKPRIAKLAVDCLASLGSRCDGCAVYACGDRAMKSSCPDPTADVECRALLKQCPGMVLDTCNRYMSALLPAGRAKLKACMSHCSLYSCAEGL